MVNLIRLNSPNFNSRPADASIDTVVIHYTGMKTAKEALDRLTSKESEVSAHYLIDENGDVYQMVDDDKRAWHAGISYWKGRTNINDFSIGIELANKGHEFGYHAFSSPQMDSLLYLCLSLKSKYDITAENFVGHSDIAPSRKEDPGELFDWKQMAKNGIGIWPSSDMPSNIPNSVIARPNSKGEAVFRMQNMLAKFGYKINQNGLFDPETIMAVVAFRRRFTPDILHPIWDNNCNHILKLLLTRNRL